MRLLINSDVLLDVLMDREPYVKNASVIWKLCETGRVEGYISALSFAKIASAMTRNREPEEVKNVLENLQMIFHLAAITEADVQKAADLAWDKFEDAVQYAIADRISAEFIVTNHTENFAKSRKAAATPHELISRCFI